MTVGWSEFAAQAPDFAQFVRGRIEEHGLALLATLAADGSPRISGIEPMFTAGDLWLGMMPNSVKGRDLRRDGRLALHNATIDKDVAHGDVKIFGVAVPVDEGRPPQLEIGGEADLFRVDLVRVSSVRVGGDHLVIETWRPGRGVETRRRY